MFRKFFAATVAALLVVGGLFAEEIKGIFKKFDDGKITITVDDKEKTFKVDPDAKVKYKNKDGEEKERSLVKSMAKWKEGAKVTLQVKDDVVTDGKIERKKKNKDKE